MANTTGKKFGGRQKGTANKVTTDLRTWINELLDSNRRQIATDIKKLEPQQRVMIFEKLLNYAVPKMQSVEAKFEFDKLSEEQIDLIISELTKDIQS
jgi:predicted P-loop ATPase/GTPase